MPDITELDPHARHILQLVAREEAVSRSQLAAAMGIAPSTVGIRVASLLAEGLLQEVGTEPSQGGRPARKLILNDDAGRLFTVDLGGGHARIGRHSMSGELLDATTISANLADGPEITLAAVGDALAEFAGSTRVRAIGIGLPGPVDIAAGIVQLPSRMPGWPGLRVGETFEKRFGVPVMIDNDANLAALGEHHAHFGRDHHSITIKAGTAVGSGIIVNGKVYRGATFDAGDITHTRIDRAANVPCSCGKTGCLETVASGAGLVRQLNERGVAVSSTAEVLELARNADPAATRVIRKAGMRLGEVLSGVVNFFNPHAVFLTGSLSSSELFIAAVRSRVYEGCHPLVTRNLRIEAARTGADAILYGAARMLIEEVSLTRA